MSPAVQTPLRWRTRLRCAWELLTKPVSSISYNCGLALEWVVEYPGGDKVSVGAKPIMLTRDEAYTLAKVLNRMDEGRAGSKKPSDWAHSARPIRYEVIRSEVTT